MQTHNTNNNDDSSVRLLGKAGAANSPAHHPLLHWMWALLWIPACQICPCHPLLLVVLPAVLVAVARQRDLAPLPLLLRPPAVGLGQGLGGC